MRSYIPDGGREVFELEDGRSLWVDSEGFGFAGVDASAQNGMMAFGLTWEDFDGEVSREFALLDGRTLLVEETGITLSGGASKEQRLDFENDEALRNGKVLSYRLKDGRLVSVARTGIGFVDLGEPPDRFAFADIAKASFHMYDLKDGRTLTLGRNGLSLSNPIALVTERAFVEIDSYMERFLQETEEGTYLWIARPDESGPGFRRADDGIEISFIIDLQKEPQRETRVRKYFSEVGVEPTEDYTFQNGVVLDSGRVLSYVFEEGSTQEYADFARDILQEIYDVAPDAPLTFRLA